MACIKTRIISVNIFQNIEKTAKSHYLRLKILKFYMQIRNIYIRKSSGTTSGKFSDKFFTGILNQR